jgi:hypothetical protein
MIFTLGIRPSSSVVEDLKDKLSFPFHGSRVFVRHLAEVSWFTSGGLFFFAEGISLWLKRSEFVSSPGGLIGSAASTEALAMTAPYLLTLAEIAPFFWVIVISPSCLGNPQISLPAETPGTVSR